MHDCVIVVYNLHDFQLFEISRHIRCTYKDLQLCRRTDIRWCLSITQLSIVFITVLFLCCSLAHWVVLCGFVLVFCAQSITYAENLMGSIRYVHCSYCGHVPTYGLHHRYDGSVVIDMSCWWVKSPVLELLMWEQLSHDQTPRLLEGWAVDLHTARLHSRASIRVSSYLVTACFLSERPPWQVFLRRTTQAWWVDSTLLQVLVESVFVPPDRPTLWPSAHC